MPSTWFERNPIKTIAIAIVVCFLILDIFAANLYKWIAGYPWSKSYQTVERTYRIRSLTYRHDLAKSKSVDNARWGPFRYHLRTNSLGFKDKSVREVPLVSDKHRILFMGDSFTEGLGFDYEHTFVGIIDSALSPKGIEVLNAAVEGYSPIIYWRKVKYLLEEVGLKFDDLMVFMDISDVRNEAEKYFLVDNGNVHDMADSADAVGSEGQESPITEFIRNNSIVIYASLKLFSQLFDDITGAWEKDMIDQKASLWTINKSIYQEYAPIGLEKMDFYMNELYKLLEMHGISMSVAVYPWPDQIVYGDLNSIHVSYWKDWCRERNIRFLDCFPYFVKGSNGKERERVLLQYYIKGDVHFNETGHRLIADAFLDFYKNK